MSPCLSDDAVCRLVAGEPLAASMEAHLDGCAACFEWVAAAFEGAAATAGASDPEDNPVGTHVGRYELRGLLGQGGMGRVFAAFDPRLRREVAIKIVRDEVFAGRSRQRARERLFGEALAMARLTHPNVVHVYEVGEHRGEVFIAMERVDGHGLHEWLRERPRSGDAILGAIVGAARGLAAAHGAGIVHRDVKPANLLVDALDHVRVSDFGLAVADAGTSPGDGRSDDTEAGTLIGTPLYMAPECLRGGPADARSDQYSLCATLFEALVGRVPIPAVALRAWRDDPDASWPELDGSGLPRALRAVVLRGLSPDPDDRHANMAELAARLDEHRRPRARWRTPWLVGAVALAPALAIAVQSTRTAPCVATEIDAVWNPERAATIRAHAVAIAPSFGAAATDAIARMTDVHAERWRTTRVDACEATRAQPDPAAPHLALQRQCLDARLVELDTLLGTVEAGDAEVLERAPAAISRWSLEPCRDPTALLGMQPLPDDPDRRGDIAAIRDELARAQALLDLGRAGEAETRITEALAAHRPIDYAPLVAEQAWLRGRIDVTRGTTGSAREHLHGALVAAHAGRHDRLQTLIYVELAAVAADPSVGDERRVSECLDLARATLGRIGDDAALRRDIGTAQAQHLERTGDLPAALAALDADTTEAAIDSADAISTRSTRASVLRGLGRYDDATAVAEDAVARSRALFGERHPAVGLALGELSMIAMDAGRLDAALAAAEAALAIRLETPEVHAGVLARAYNDVGAVRWRLGQLPEARAAFERALTLMDEAGTRAAAYGVTADNLGVVLMQLGDLDGAERQFRAAIEVLSSTAGPTHFDVALAQVNLGELLYQRRRFTESIATLEDALGINERARGVDHPQNAHILMVLGKNRIALEEPAAAVPLLERALALRESVPDDTFVRGAIRYALAQAMLRAGGERARARDLVLAAIVDFRAAGAPASADLERALQWIDDDRSASADG